MTRPYMAVVFVFTLCSSIFVFQMNICLRCARFGFICTPGKNLQNGLLSNRIISEIYNAPITKRTYTIGASQKSAKC